MKIAYTSDIHIDNSAENADIPEEIAGKLMDTKPDVFILAGDVSHLLDQVNSTLAVFKSVACPKLFIPGNHDIWVENKCNSSYEKYNNYLPQIARENGFIPLWIEPFILKGYGFIGSMGWYDYSLKNANVEIPQQQYKEKSYSGIVWNDKNYARFMSGDRPGDQPGDQRLEDEEITRAFYSEFINQYSRVKTQSEKIVAVFHHLPFRDMLHYTDIKQWDYFAAFMGSECFGDFILKEKKFVLSISGHLHRKLRKTISRPLLQDNITAVSSPFGYFASEAHQPALQWYADRLSFIEI